MTRWCAYSGPMWYGGAQGRAAGDLLLLPLRAASEVPAMHAYVVVSLLTGARTEELRALTWSRVHLDTSPPTLELWRAVRAHGDTKTTKSRRTLELPSRCIDVRHANTRVTELVYRKELRPVLTRGAAAMDDLFPDGSAGWQADG